MKRFVLLLAAAFVFTLSGFAQKTPADAKLAQVATELKTSLVSKLKWSDGDANKIVTIENDFHQKLTAIKALGDIPAKERETKLNEAHTARRAALMALPMTGRQMEDVVEASDRVWSKFNP